MQLRSALRPALVASLFFASVGLVSADPLPAGIKPSDIPPGLIARCPRRVVLPFASSGVVGYRPAQIRHAYGLDQITNSGSGQTIGIVVAYGSPTAQNDLNVFSDTFSLPRTTLNIVYPKGNPTTVDTGWALETSLDIEWAHAIAPKAKIVLAVAPNSSISNLLSAVDAAVSAGAKVVSMSWGSSEFLGQGGQDTHFSAAGVSYFASSGDNGSTAGTGWPAASAKVTAVGGTTLVLDASGNVLSSEVAWAGSGGGYSRYVTRPSYQNGWHSNSARAYPDVSLVADPATGVAVYNSTPGNGTAGWWQVGGTSASSPIWAAAVAIANEIRKASAKATLPGANGALYSAAGSTDLTGKSLYPFYYYDVTTGNTGNYSATAKFDVTTGLGTPQFAHLFTAATR